MNTFRKHVAMNNRAFSVVGLFLSLLLLSFLIRPGMVRGQSSEARNPQRGAVPGASYSLSDIENINLTNGNLLLDFPLVSTPKWRGGLNLTRGLTYNSKLFDTIILKQPNHSNQLTDQYFIKKSLDGGWGGFDSLSYYLKVSNRFEPGEAIPCELGVGLQTYGKNAAVWKVQIVFPGGNAKEFRPHGYNDFYGDGYFNISPNGYLGWASYEEHELPGGERAFSCDNGGETITTGPMAYYSTDGTFIRLVIDHDPTPGSTGQFNSFTLYFPDGSKYQSSNTRFTDRFGNFIEGSEFTYNGVAAEGLTDESGRKVFSTAGSNSNETFVYQLGFGGAEIKWTIRRKTVYVRREYETTEATSLMQRGGSSTQIFDESFEVIDEIVQPGQLGGQKYEFEYFASDIPLGPSEFSEGWGEIKSVRLPSGAKAEYEYNSIPVTNTKRILERSVKKKTLTYFAEYDGGYNPVEEVWNYAVTNLGATVTSPDGSVTTQSHGDTSYTHETTGLVTKIENSNGSMVEKMWASNKSPWSSFMNQFVTAEFTSVKDSTDQYALTAIKAFTQDKNGNTTSIKEYDFVPYTSVPRNGSGRITGLPGGITPIRTTYTSYYNATEDSSNSTANSSYAYWNYSAVKNVVESTEIRNGSEIAIARSEFVYDNYSTTANPILVKTWDSNRGAITFPLTTGEDGNAITTSATYNQYGMPLTTTDANNVTTRITYGDVAGPNGVVTDLYPTQTEVAYGTPIARTSTAVYDFYTGLVTTATDVDNNVSTVTTYDALGRPTKVATAANTLFESWTQTEYYDSDRYVVVRSDLETKDDRKKVATQFFDQLGRVRLTKTLEDASTQSATNETDGIKVETRYQTGNPNSYQLTSNPFRAATATAAGNEPTMGWTRSKSWNTGRKSEVETFSGSALPAPWGTNTNSTGIVTTDIDANATTVTDQADKQRRSITNALGQLIRVDEPDKTTGQLGSVAAPVQPTYYEYNTLGKMVHVQQDIQHRWFMYDSVGRLLRVKQPEQDANGGLTTTGNPGNNSWTAGFAYDSNGNVLTATDAKGTTITNTYDALNRPLTRTYSNEPQGISTPTVTNSYDGVGISPAPGFAKGKLTKVTSSVSESRYTDFDAAGRLKQFQQITDGQTYTSSYEYNLSGALIRETYPSGRVVENEFDASGDLAKIFGKATPASIERTYANNFTYSPDGKIERLRLGSGVWESAKFNSRLQVTELSVGWGPSSGSIWKMATEYGELQTDGTVDLTTNSGNIGKQTVSFTGLAQPFVQSFSYDALQRLTEAKETNNGNQTYRQVFDYDRYGNRTTHNKWIGTTQVVHDNKTHPTIDAASNRFQTNQGFVFDPNGNITTDGDGRQFTFNGDNKQSEVRDAANRLIGKYFFDGEGKRVKKEKYNAAGLLEEVVVFVYSGGKLIAEYSTTPPPAPPEATTRFTVTDQLGSPRVILDSAGDVISRRDFLPFGEEIAPDTTYRTDALKYGQTDHVRQKFTGYQSDEETGLDFAEARMYENRHGRFTAVDPLLASGKSANPQSFNRYVYVFNNPLIFIDPEGLQAGTTMWFRTRSDGGRSFVTTRGGRPRGRDWERWSGTENVRSTDGTVQRVSSSGFTGVGIWNRNAAIPSQGISSSVTPGAPDTRAQDLVSGVPGGLEQAAANTVGGAVAATAVLACVVACVPAAAGVGAAAASAPISATGPLTAAAAFAIGTVAGNLVEGEPDSSPPVNVVHFTDDAGVQAITASGGVLRPGTFVTLPGQIPAGASATQIEGRLEIEPGRGSNSITFQTPASNLAPAPNGITTSGGALQFVLRGATPVDPDRFVRTPR